MPSTNPALPQAIEWLSQQLSELQAIYLFGSEATGSAGPDSDIDLAVLLPRPLAAADRWALASRLAERLGREIDLIDLREASTVMQHQVVAEGERLWQRGQEADEFELVVLSEYWDLTILRRGLIDDIKQRGTIHGR